MKKSTCLIAAIITSLSLNAAQAAPPKPRPAPPLTAQQVAKIQIDQTKEEVISILGNPTASPKWRNGTHSLVYPVSDRTSKPTLYIDIDNKTNKVIRTVVMPESETGTGSEGSSGGDSGGPS